MYAILDIDNLKRGKDAWMKSINTWQHLPVHAAFKKRNN